jgi:trimeric autotransporter adhesin
MRVPVSSSAAVFLLLASVAGAERIIDTYAGGGPAADAPATAQPMGINAVVPDRTTGDLIIADADPPLVRRISATTGVVTPFAGQHGAACGPGLGDGGPATLACLDAVRMAQDDAGNVFIADAANRRIRRVDATTGTIATVAGGGSGPLGDGGPATAATLRQPTDLALDPAGNLFVADQMDRRVRRIDAITGVITTVVSGITALGGIACDAAGDLYVSDSGNHRVMKRDATTGLTSVIAGNGSPGFCGDGGPAASACLFGPAALAIDAGGGLLIDDHWNVRVRRVDATTGTITTVAGWGGSLLSCEPDLGEGGPATGACLDNVRDLDVDSAGGILIADIYAFRLWRIDPATQVITTVASNGEPGFCGDGGPATDACLDLPYGIAIDGAGNVYVADSENLRIRKIDASTHEIATVAGSANGVFVMCPPYPGDGTPASELCFHPFEFTVDVDGNIFTSISDGRVVRIDAQTHLVSTIAGGGGLGFCGDGGPAATSCVNFVLGIAIDPGGNIYLADGGNSRIRRVDAASGIITTVAGNGDLGVCGDGGPATSACIGQPTGVALDPAGNLYLSDPSNRVVRRVDASSGVITTIASGFLYPSGIAADVLGNVFVTDFDFGVYRIDAVTHAAEVVAGNGLSELCGDGGPATDACVTARALAVALDGTLLLADAANGRVRRVRCTTPDADGDGVCDEYDFDGALGLAVRSAEVKESGTATKKVGKLLVDATVATSGDTAGFFQRARQTGVVARVVSKVAPPALAAVSALQFAAAECRFSPSAATIPTTLSCKRKGPGRRAGLRLRRTSPAGDFRMSGKMRDPRIRVPPTGALVVVLDTNDVVAERYQGTAASCRAGTKRNRQLDCTAEP